MTSNVACNSGWLRKAVILCCVVATLAVVMTLQSSLFRNAGASFNANPTDAVDSEILNSFNGHDSIVELERTVLSGIRLPRPSWDPETSSHKTKNYTQNIKGTDTFEKKAVKVFDSLTGILVLVQGKVSQAKKWVELLKFLQAVHVSSTIALVYGVYGMESTADNEKLQLQNSTTVFVDLGGTSWTTGRNMLAAAGYQLEVEAGVQFKYWVYADQDSDIQCSVNSTIDSEFANTKHACWQLFVAFLLDPYMQVPVVALIINAQSKLFKTVNFDSPKAMSYVMLSTQFDAVVNVFHRWVVPILLPYVAELDSASWWNSQALLFPVLFGCLPYGGLLPFGFTAVNPEHNPYPRGRVSVDVERRILQKTYGRYSVLNWPIDGQHIEQTDQYMYRRGPFHIDNLGPDELVLWPFNFRTQACFERLAPRFDLHVSTTVVTRYVFFGVNT